MKIDITKEPPVDIFRDRGKHLRISFVLLALVLCGGGLIVYGLVSDTPQNEFLETLVLALFVVPAMAFVYFGEKLQDYKKLNPGQQKELADLGRKHPEITTYCALVAKQGRVIVHAEYEACKYYDEDPRRQT
jgi:hypothetical protein